MAMVVLYHCTCYFAHTWWPFGEGPYNPILKIITTFMGGILSKNSMGIYLIHQIIICCVITDPSIKMRLDSSNSYLVVLVLFVGSLVSSWMLASLLNRFNITRFVIGSKMNV